MHDEEDENRKAGGWIENYNDNEMRKLKARK